MSKAMTLKEKFETKSSIDTTKEAKVFASECEEIADEYAIGFAEFSINYNYHPMHKVWIRYGKTANEKFTTIELLEIYKKEKGL